MTISRGNTPKQVSRSKKNPVAKDLRTPKYRKRVVEDKKKKANKYKARKNK